MSRLTAAIAAILALALVAGVVTATASAASWRTVVVADDADTSEWGSLDLNLSTTLKGVRGWRLVSRISGAALSTDVDVDCEKGGTDARRSIEFKLLPGSRARTLPLPIKGGRCTVNVWAYSFGDPGSASLTVQALR